MNFVKELSNKTVSISEFNRGLAGRIFDDVNKLLKLDPGNTELISQKHKLLVQTIEEEKNN